MDANASVSDDLNLETEWRGALSLHGSTRVYPPQAILIHEGEAGDLLYLIHERAGQIYSMNESGKVIVYALYEPGDLLGEPTLDGGLRSASVMALKKTTCSVIRARDFKAMIAAHPSLAMHLIFKLTRMLRASNEHVKSLALDDVYGRVVRLLMKRSKPDGEIRVIDEKLKRQTIADHVGSSSEMVGRIMKDLESGNYIAIEKDRIVIKRKPPPGW